MLPLLVTPQVCCPPALSLSNVPLGGLDSPYVLRPQHSTIPLLVTPRGIAWVAGYRIANWARVTPDDTRVFEIILRNQHS